MTATREKLPASWDLGEDKLNKLAQSYALDFLDIADEMEPYRGDRLLIYVGTGQISERDNLAGRVLVVAAALSDPPSEVEMETLMAAIREQASNVNSQSTA